MGKSGPDRKSPAERTSPTHMTMNASDEERDLFDAAARSTGQNRTQWAKSILLAAAKRALAKSDVEPGRKTP